MPEHDTFDLDAAFRALEQDLGRITGLRGADLAVATARRRRRTTIASVAAVTVLAVAGVAVGQGIGHHDSGVGPSDSPLPGPTQLTAQALDAATDGWMKDWAVPTDSSQQQQDALEGIGCLSETGTDSPLNSADQVGGTLYVSGSTGLASIVGLHFTSASDEEAVEQSMSVAAARCQPFKSATTTYPDGSSVTYDELNGKGSSDYDELWVAHYGDRLGLAITHGADDQPSNDVVNRVGDLMLRILQEDSTFTMTGAGDVISSTASASISEVQQISDGDFSTALGSWPTQWRQSGTKVDPSELPCAGDWDNRSSGMGASIGANGAQEFASFDAATSAAASADTLAGHLEGCSSSPVSDVWTGQVSGGAVTVTVGIGSSARIVWIVHKGDQVAYVSIPGDKEPPDQVIRAVAGLIVASLDSATQGPPPVESSTPVQQQRNATSGSSSGAASPQG